VNDKRFGAQGEFQVKELRAGGLTFDEYQEKAGSTDRLIRTDPRLAFPLLGLFGEAGSLR
jgi:hypothetical protein